MIDNNRFADPSCVETPTQGCHPLGLLSVETDFPLDAGPVHFLFSLTTFCTLVPPGPCQVDFNDPITLTLPQGVTFTSQSGEFLTGSPAAAPEPGTLVLLAAGLAGLGFSRRKVRVNRQ